MKDTINPSRPPTFDKARTKFALVTSKFFYSSLKKILTDAKFPFF